jgi:NADPH:quinone reductase-like Zn-dependent oxidoreductase
MKAYVSTGYGNPDILKLVDQKEPVANEDQYLVKNYVTTINSADIRLRKADPWLVRLALGIFKPRIPVSGIVYSGYIVENDEKTKRICGLNFTTFGAFGEYLLIPKKSEWAYLPDEVSFEEGASLLFGGHTALYYLRKAKIKKGDKILIYGASGSVGVSSIQLAKYFGAEVTAVCSTKHLEEVKKLGADIVIDYTNYDLKTHQEKYDIVYDTVGKGNELILANLVKKGKTLILGSALIKGAIKGFYAKIKYKIDLVIGVAETNQEDLQFLITLFTQKYIDSITDKKYEFEEMKEAHSYVEKGHRFGNVIVRIQN